MGCQRQAARTIAAMKLACLLPMRLLVRHVHLLARCVLLPALVALGAWPAAWAAGKGAAASADCPPAAQSLLTPRALEQARKQPRDRGYLWRLERDGHSSWLYGTLHLGRANWVVPGPLVSKALRASDTMALELDPLDAEAMQPLFSPADPARLAQVMSPERQQRLAQQWQAACAKDAAGLFAQLQPLLQASVLSGHSAQRDGLYTDFAIDVVLAGYARHAGLPLVALETAQSQLALFTGDTAEEEAQQIDAALQELESGRLRQRMGELAAMWARSDWPRLQAYEQWCECMKTPAERAFMHKLLDERNPVLADGIEALHADGQRVFAAVGALHMVGPAGLPTLLEQRGFTLTQVLPPPR